MRDTEEELISNGTVVSREVNVTTYTIDVTDLR